MSSLRIPRYLEFAKVEKAIFARAPRKQYTLVTLCHGAEGAQFRYIEA